LSGHFCGGVTNILEISWRNVLSKKVLVIDDDPELGKLIDALLTPIEFTVYQAYSGEEGLKKTYAIHPDLIILDIMMPGMDGFDVCSRLRELVTIPILMLTARPSENDMLHGFNVGVDDFLRKPFSKNELEVRVRALLRRSKNQNSGETSYITSYTDPVLEIDLSSETVTLCGNTIELSPREYGLLAYLVREQGKVISHRELVREVWGEQYINSSDMSSLYIFYLRNKLQDGQHGHKYIHTLWGRGYWFAPRKDNQS
jgi:two-component system response regulator ArlR